MLSGISIKLKMAFIIFVHNFQKERVAVEKFSSKFNFIRKYTDKTQWLMI